MKTLEKPQYDAPPSDPDDRFRYEILTAGFESNGEWKTGKNLRMDYLRLTDKLTYTITQGIEVTDESTGEKTRRPYSTVVFLDKSARPISHLVRAGWPLFAKDVASGEVPPMPAFKFLNIDRRQWVDQIDPTGSGMMSPDRIHPSFMWSLRSIFLTSEGKKRVQEEGLTEAVEEMSATLDDQTVLVVDETSFSGETLKIATGLMERAFPTAHIKGTYWMDEKIKGHPRNPRWYDDTTRMGRGVNDRYSDVKDLSPRTEEYYRKFGKWFLSSPHWRVAAGIRDEGYHQLIREIKELAANPDVPILPFAGRSDFEDRIITYNDGGGDVPALTPLEKEAAVDRIMAQKKIILRASKSFKNYP